MIKVMIPRFASPRPSSSLSLSVVIVFFPVQDTFSVDPIHISYLFGLLRWHNASARGHPRPTGCDHIGGSLERGRLCFGAAVRGRPWLQGRYG